MFDEIRSEDFLEVVASIKLFFGFKVVINKIIAH